MKHIITRDHSDFTAQSLQVARTKIPIDTFKDINRALQKQSSEGPCVYAIDGSKVHVHPCYKNEGFTSRTNNKPVERPAVRPLAMLSSMLNVLVSPTVQLLLLPKAVQQKRLVDTILHTAWRWRG